MLTSSSELITLYEKKTPETTYSDNRIHFNGEDNLDPYLVEVLKNNSPTALKCATINANYLYGRGFNKGDEIWNIEKGFTANDILDAATQSLCPQNGVFIRITYNGLGKKQLEVLRYEDCRKAKHDSDGFEGLLIISNWKGVSRYIFSKNKYNWLYAYSNDEKVIKEQQINDCRLAGIENPTGDQLLEYYRGQWVMLNLSNLIYPFSQIQSVKNDLDSEIKVSEYINTHASSGFLGKQLVLCKGLDSTQIEQVKDIVKGSLGAANSNKVGFIDFGKEAMSVDFDQVIKLESVKAQFDDELFEATSKMIVKKVASVFDGLPVDFVYADSGGLFSLSGNGYREMKVFYNEQTYRKRQKIQDFFNKLLDRSDLEIEEINTTENNEVNV